LTAQLLHDHILAYPIENFARFDEASRHVTLSAALALYDAGIAYAKGKKQNIGILGTNPDGALISNLAYFEDYLAGGRTLGRAKFFIYTLPSSPLAEAAIHLGLQGPMTYMLAAKTPRETLWAHAGLLIKNEEVEAMLVISSTSEATECRVLTGEYA